MQQFQLKFSIIDRPSIEDSVRIICKGDIMYNIPEKSSYINCMPTILPIKCKSGMTYLQVYRKLSLAFFLSSGSLARGLGTLSRTSWGPTSPKCLVVSTRLIDLGKLNYIKFLRTLRKKL